MRILLAIALMTIVTSTGCSDLMQTETVAVDAIPAAQPVVVAFNEDDNPTIEFNVPGLHCEHCAASACELVKAIDGVVDVQANAETKLVTVAVKDKDFDSDKARKVLEEQFGEATLVESEEA
ncbi:heavy-metal-associated domain-containing protein [Aeoliella sp.]|uniref:heavy-metal-associated domain-containing protein n=1 Tax=Aeoliella sp. TaxID=2795800 RepID=UPI003CCB8065